MANSLLRLAEQHYAMSTGKTIETDYRLIRAWADAVCEDSTEAICIVGWLASQYPTEIGDSDEMLRGLGTVMHLLGEVADFGIQMRDIATSAQQAALTVKPAD
ncbi:hypothetical protein ACEU07_03755 [Chromobacterium violaceum]|uniref:hypothetical protein n=1 Tax=Chromobacterium violaceum TaxID=536 RepID=UPI0035A5E4FD